jgi:16S rRNA (adenine1518-N6/adenine1519-N6)-dimethyltransferase
MDPRVKPEDGFAGLPRRCAPRNDVGLRYSVVNSSYSNNIKALKQLGQNFLNDARVVERIIRTASPLKDETVLEIGPGLGALTRVVLECPVRRLICIEYDKRCVEYLRVNLESEKLDILNEDALKLDEKKLIENGQKLIIISNLPYNISTLLLGKWLEEITLFKRMVLMFQKEVAERICAKPNNKQYGILSVLTQFLCSVSLEFDIPRTAFTPQPKIISSVVSIVPKGDLEDKLRIYKKLELLCKTVFNKRRKTLRNSIAPLLADPEKSLSSLGLDSNRRPETLSIDEFELIVRKLEF